LKKGVKNISIKIILLVKILPIINLIFNSAFAFE